MAELGPVTCAGCGLLCDDVTVASSSNGVRLRPECPLGEQWFSESMRQPDDDPARIDGQTTDLETALARAAELLRGARRPLLHGFEHATVEDARAAVALADRLGALLSTQDGTGPWPGAPAVPLRGASTATLGEIRDRSQLVVIWREDPETTHPRLLERLGFGGPERSGRVLAVIDDQDTATTQRAHVRLTWPRERDLESLTSLHVLQRGLELRSCDLGDEQSDLADELSDLATRLGSVPHAALVYGPGLSAGAGGQRRVLALHELVRALSHERHVVTLELPRAPGTRSAEDVLAWQSGYGWAVDFAAGHPEWITTTRTPDEADVTLRVESGPAGSVVSGGGVEVWMRTAAAGVQAPGTVHRLDGVPLTLQVLAPDGAPSAAALLTRMLAQVG